MDSVHDSERVVLPELKRVWVLAGGTGILLWVMALALWAQGTLDERVVFLFDPARAAYTPLVSASKFLSAFGMPVILALYVLYYVIQIRRPAWSASRTLYLYVIFSFGLSGIAGDLLKLVFARPRPAAAFPDQILALSDAASHALPSGHATKAMALALPVLFLVSSRPRGQAVWKGLIAAVALGVGFSRIVLGAHYLSDVVAGFGMALLGLPASMALAHMILRRIPGDQLPGAARRWVIIMAVLAAALFFL